MAGRVVVSTLNNDTGPLATQNGMTGIAKAWVYFAVNTSGVVTVNSSFNIGSVTRSAAGRFLFTFTTNMPSASYSVSGLSGLDPTSGTTTFPCPFTNASGTLQPTASTFGVCFIAPTTGGVFDPVLASIVVHAS
jgi:hypothetical protein